MRPLDTELPLHRCRCRRSGGIACDSLDCGVYFVRRKLAAELAAVQAMADAGLRQLDEAAAADLKQAEPCAG